MTHLEKHLQSVPMFHDEAAYRQAFERGLEKLLDIGGLNLFILVLANAGFEQPVFNRLRKRLLEQYGDLSEKICTAFLNGCPVDEADDDLLVFMKVHSIGFDKLSMTEQYQAGPWEVQFNHLRSFRPLRNETLDGSLFLKIE